jgi:hypothetical protein
VGLVALLLSWLPLGFAQLAAALLLGVLLLDLAVQLVHEQPECGDRPAP